MGRKRTNRVGERVGCLEVMGSAASRKDKLGYDLIYWSCVCTCGRIIEVANTNWGRTFRCDECAKAIRGKTRQLPPGIVLRNGVLADYKKSAKLRGYDWYLSDDHAIQLFQGNCHYCGVAPSTVLSTPSSYGGPRWEFVYNGIDRKDNSLGYIESNVVPCCKFCQYAKRDLLYQEFLDHLIRVGNHQINKATTEASIGH